MKNFLISCILFCFSTVIVFAQQDPLVVSSPSQGAVFDVTNGDNTAPIKILATFTSPNSQRVLVNCYVRNANEQIIMSWINQIGSSPYVFEKDIALPLGSYDVYFISFMKYFSTRINITV